MLALLQRMNRSDITAHGFRSTFRDWAAERTNFPRAVAEMALSSGIGARMYAAPMLMPEHAFWFGEDQARYVVTVRPADVDPVVARLKAAGVPVRRIGATYGNALTLPGESPILLKRLSERFEGWLPAYMAGGLS